jgi:hypothetical protein
MNYNSKSNNLMKKKLFSLFIICFFILKTGQSQTIEDTTKPGEVVPDTTVSPLQVFKLILSDSFTGFDTATSPNDRQIAGNRLGLIANKWADQWAAQYYACYSTIVLSFLEKDELKKDAYLDESDKYMAKVKELKPGENDEIYVMSALIANARIAVKPGSRWKQYGDIFNADIEKAKALQPNNPRIYYLQGNSVLHTPKMFGGGSKNALPYFEKADTLFQAEKTDDIFKPFWGKKQNAEMLKNCKEDTK